MRYSGKTLWLVLCGGILILFGVCQQSHAQFGGWGKKISGSIKRAGGAASDGFKNSAGRSWNRTVRDPWYKKVYRPTVVDPYNRGDRAMEEARRRYQAEWNRRVAAWNEKVRRYRSAITNYVRQNAHRWGLRSEREINLEISRRMRSFILKNPYPKRN